MRLMIKDWISEYDLYKNMIREGKSHVEAKAHIEWLINTPNNYFTYNPYHRHFVYSNEYFLELLILNND